jgi:hypothetical protein
VGWQIVYYIFTFLKGIMFFSVIMLVGTGWSLLKVSRLWGVVLCLFFSVFNCNFFGQPCHRVALLPMPTNLVVLYFSFSINPCIVPDTL